MRTRIVGTALLLVAALGGAGAAAGPAHAAGPYPPPSSVTAQADPSRVAPGECTTFSGTGFDRLATLALADNGASRGSTRADVNGRFSTRICFASDAKRGKHVLSATGSTPSGTQTASAVVRVVGVSESADGHGSGGPGAGGGSGGGASGGRGAATGAGQAAAGQAVAGQDLPLLPRTDGSAAGGGKARVVVGDASESAVLDGLSALMLSLFGALGLALCALLLLIIGRRRERERERGALAVA